MAPQKTNFKTYESATRLLAAVIATSNPKLNFNDIAKHMGKDYTGSAIDHRLRPIKQLAKLQAQCLEGGSDPGELPIDKGEIQKLFGESTPDGLEFQFRSIKKLGIAQKAAVEKGEDPAKLVVGNVGTGTPRAGRVSTATTPGSRKRAAIAKTPTSKRARGKKATAESDDESNDTDYDAKDVDTPTSKKPKVDGQSTVATPTPRKAASNGNAGSSFASTHTMTNSVNVDNSFASAVGPPSTTSSLFGDGSRPSTSFTVPPPKANISSAVYDDDDDLVEIDGSQFSQSRTQSSSRKAPVKQEPEDQRQSSMIDLYSNSRGRNHGNSYASSFISVPQANQSFYDENELTDGEA